MSQSQDPTGPARARRTLQQLHDEDDGYESLRPDLIRRHRPELCRHVQIWTPRGKYVSHLVSTEKEVTGLLLHRIDGRSELCTQSVRYCYGCKLGLPRRWMGYLGCFEWYTRKPLVLSITPYALLCLFKSWPRGQSLLHVGLAVCRATDSTRSKELVQAKKRVTNVIVPYEAEAAPVLARVFNTPALELPLLEDLASKFLLDNPYEAAGE